MNTATMLQSLRDPMGVPFYPWLFQALMILTFALHIFMVNIVIGSIGVAVWARIKGGDYNSRLSATLAKATTINISVAMLLGIAPLLFVQVIYDPFWYSSTLMSGWWSMIFLGAAIVGFLSMYVFYLKNACKSCKCSYTSYGVLALVALLLSGAIMHVLAMQALTPEKWTEWYAPAGKMLTGGWGFHAKGHGRFLHFLAPSFINTGIFLMLYGWYMSARKDAERPYLEYVAGLGAKMAKYGVMAQVAIGLWFLMEIPSKLSFATNPFFIVGVALALTAAGFVITAGRDPIGKAPIVALISVVAVLGMSTAREVLRMAYVGQFNYSIYDYPVRVDWGSTLLFLLTFVMGLVVTAYPVLLAFKAGRGEMAKEDA